MLVFARIYIFEHVRLIVVNLVALVPRWQLTLVVDVGSQRHHVYPLHWRPPSHSLGSCRSAKQLGFVLLCLSPFVCVARPNMCAAVTLEVIWDKAFAFS